MGQHLVCEGCCSRNATDWVAYKQEEFIFMVLKVGKSKIKAQADLMSGESLLPRRSSLGCNFRLQNG